MTATSAAVAGADGCPAGWLCVSCRGSFERSEARIVPDAAALLHLPARVIAIDMPIGLDAIMAPGGRDVDLAARRFLACRAGGLRGTSSRVFNASRQMIGLLGLGYHAANARLPEGGRFSKQAFNIAAKIADLDRTISKDGSVWEVHPEVSFAAMTGRTLPPKKSPAGRAERRAALTGLGFPLDDLAAALGRKSRRWGADDLLDACAEAWSARRIAAHDHATLPDPPLRDATGHRMAIHY